MIDFESIRKPIVKGLKDYLQCQVIRGNQNAPMPKFPYCTYNIITPESENKGTYGIYEDGKARKPVTLTLSFTSHSDDYAESVNLASKAREWLDYVGTTVLSDNNIDIESVGGITDRSNLLSVEYEYSYGFDCFISAFDVIESAEQIGEGEIKTAQIGEAAITQMEDYDELNERLEKRLDGVK